jgi:hypothetical protein
MELFIGPAISGMAVAACKIAEISFKLANVDDQISVYESILANNSETVRSVRQQIATKKRYLSCRDLNDYYRALDNSDRALDGIRDLINKVRTDAGPDGSLATMQKVTWSLRDAKKAAERVTLMTNCHTTMERILTTLSAIPTPSRSVPWAQKMDTSVPVYRGRYIWEIR